LPRRQTLLQREARWGSPGNVNAESTRTATPRIAAESRRRPPIVRRFPGTRSRWAVTPPPIIASLPGARLACSRDAPSQGSFPMTPGLPPLRQWMCGLHGHDAVLRFEQNRLSLRCVACGYETAGWSLPRHRGAASNLDEHSPHIPSRALDRWHRIAWARPLNRSGHTTR
jgi:hypothetical protein